MSGVPAPPPRRAPAPAPRPPPPHPVIAPPTTIQCVVCDQRYPREEIRFRGAGAFCVACFKSTDHGPPVSRPRPVPDVFDFNPFAPIPPAPEPTKACTRCGVEKPIGAFARSGRGASGAEYRRSECKTCSKPDRDAWRASDKGKKLRSQQESRRWQRIKAALDASCQRPARVADSHPHGSLTVTRTGSRQSPARVADSHPHGSLTVTRTGSRNSDPHGSPNERPTKATTRGAP